MSNDYQIYYDIIKYAEEKIKTASDEEIERMYWLTYEDRHDVIANKIRSEYFRRELRSSS